MVTRRNLTLVFIFLILWILLALVLPVLNARAAAPTGGWVVTRLDDPLPDGCQTGDCSLREAMIAADIPTATLISFAVTGTIELTRGTLNLHGFTILQGNGADQTVIDANGMSGVIHIFPSQNNPFCFPNIRDVTMTGGNRSEGGGVLVAAECHVAVRDSVIRNNQASGKGGGVAFPGSGDPAATLFLTNTAVISNTAADGGGLWLQGRGTMLTNVTLSGNHATNRGGGIFFEPLSNAIFTLRSVTLANNRAAIADAVAFEELSPPQNGNLRFLNTLLTSTSTSACATLGFDTLTFTSLGYNVADDLSCQLGHAADLSNTNPRLAPLQWDSGTYVHVPILTSPALDSGTAGNLTTDQRGLPRPVDLPGLPNANDGADRGAYEHQSVPPTVITLTEFLAQRDSGPPFAWLALITISVGVAWWRHRRHL